jgi:hypothetical protein
VEATAAEDVRSKIMAIIDARLPQLQTERHLDGFLEELARQARANNQVTALEVEPGLAALRSFQGRLDADTLRQKKTEFLDRMKKLGQLAAPAEPPPDRALANLLQQMDQAANPDDLGRLQADYLRVALRLEPKQRSQAMAEIEKRRHANSTAKAP